MHVRWRWFLFVAMMVLLTGVSWGNGVYIPQQAYPALPTIPVQRAVIVHRDGVQTLVVESAFQTESKDVAWILPLPKVPVKLEMGDAGMVTAMCMAVRPKIVFDWHWLWPMAVCVLAMCGTFALVRVLTVDRKRWWRRYVLYLAIVTLAVVSGVIWLKGYPLTVREGIAFTESSRVWEQAPPRLGDYECVVLSSADELSQWLAERSMRPLDERGLAVVADYVARGWCFVAAQLRPEAGKMVTPRPLVVTFATPSPVLPMRLTSLANTETYMELCVVADRQAVVKHFDAQVAAAFRKPGKRDYYAHWPNISPYYHAASVDLRIGSPDMVPLMWENCVVTKLVGNILMNKEE